MMTYTQYLLSKIAEECGEIAQEALKAQQFGLYETEPGQQADNADRLGNEISDLKVIISLLEDHEEINLDTTTNENRDYKKAKVDRYHKFAQTRGQVEL